MRFMSHDSALGQSLTQGRTLHKRDFEAYPSVIEAVGHPALNLDQDKPDARFQALRKRARDLGLGRGTRESEPVFSHRGLACKEAFLRAGHGEAFERLMFGTPDVGTVLFGNS